eukprot:scaffold67919_cov32-Tisochrysis_lutea.AAC.2
MPPSPPRWRACMGTGRCLDTQAQSYVSLTPWIDAHRELEHTFYHSSSDARTHRERCFTSPKHWH